MGISALIFDVDGTLADTEEAHRAAFNQAFANQGLGWTWGRDEYRTLLEITGGKERMAAYIEALPASPAERRRLTGLIPALHADKTRLYTTMVADGALSLRPGIARLCDEALAAGALLAIASTTSPANVDALLASAFGRRGIEMFSVIACGDQVRAKKPAPDVYQLALRHLELDAGQAVAFEDSVNGLRAARGADLWTVVTPTFWSESSDFSAAQLVLPELGDPGRPLPGEPGARLRRTAWLTFAELEQQIATAQAGALAALGSEAAR